METMIERRRVESGLRSGGKFHEIDTLLAVKHP
jgi:hypothetical protein